MKKAIRRSVTMLMAVLICTIVFIPASASTSTVKVYVDDKIVAYDAEPYVDNNNRTMVPVRFVSEKLGAKVEWNDSLKIVTITKDDDMIQMTIGDTAMTVNKELSFMDTCPVIKKVENYSPIKIRIRISWCYSRLGSSDKDSPYLF